MEIKSIKRDASRIEAGEWVAGIPQMGDLRLKVRGFGSAAYEQAVGRRIRALPVGERERDGSPTPAAMKRITAESMHEAILLDWDGLTDDGEAVPYDSAVALIWLTDPDFLHFRQAVDYAGRVVDNGRAAIEGDIAKN